MTQFRTCVAAAFCALALSSPDARAQNSLPPWQGGMTASLGQPIRTRLYTGLSGGADWRASEVSSVAFGLLGMARPVGNPVAGVLGVAAEGYAGMRSTEFDAGVRALAQLPIFRLSGGAEFDIMDRQLGFVLGFTMPTRRGGIIGGGSLLRAEWRSGAQDALRASLLIPLRQPAAGNTRPLAQRVAIAPRASRAHEEPRNAPALDTVLAHVSVGVQRMHDLLVPHIDGPGADPRKALAPIVERLRTPAALPDLRGPGVQSEAVINRYHDDLERAFSMIAGADDPSAITADGRRIARLARATLLEHLIYPYNRLLGQWKTTSTVTALAAYARGNFARNVLTDAPETVEREQAALHIFERLLDDVVALEREQRRQWGDSRLIWLPLQLGLRPEDHDTQAELDSVVEAAVGQPFTDGNRVWYIVNEEFQTEVIRSIRRARDYHVVWIHDFRGRNARGQPDALSLRYVVDAYFEALTEHVRAYDGRRRMPTYMVFIDELYYNSNRARLWFDVLEKPLTAEPRLPKGFEAIAESIRAKQRELREAVASSRLLQAEAAQYGDAWLRNLLKVHINVTNPADESFWSRQIMPGIGVPDNVMRDHRKIVFYDISEADPYAGLAIYTGMGIGEHYAGPTWEDRALMVQGPALLSLKTQARRLLESQGLSGDRVPYVLRPQPLAADYHDAVAAEVAAVRASGRRDQRALELHNQTGFAEKQVSVAKATLYSLMPPGSVIKVPDSLWGNAVYAALLTGSALRGCRVLFIAPSLAAAPSAGWPQMSLAHDLFSRLIVLQQELGTELEAAGGMLKTGIYNPGVGVNEVGPRFENAYRNARRTPFLRRLFPIDASVDTLLANLQQLLPATKAASTLRTGEKVMPKLHLKANFFATREAWDSLIARREMGEVLTVYVMQLLRTDRQQSDAQAAANNIRAVSERLEASFSSNLSPQDREKLIYYMMIGSANADYRSMFMDGEASVLLSGWSGVVGLIDFSLIANLSVWIDDLELLDALLPPPAGLQRGISRWLRPAL